MEEYEDWQWQCVLAEEPQYTLADIPILVAVIEGLDQGLASEYGTGPSVSRLKARGVYDAMYRRLSGKLLDLGWTSTEEFGRGE